MNGDWPNNNVKAGLANQNDIKGNYVKSIRVNDNVIIKMYGYDANKAILNKKVALTGISSLGVIRWEWASGAIKDSYLPSACR